MLRSSTQSLSLSRGLQARAGRATLANPRLWLSPVAKNNSKSGANLRHQSSGGAKSGGGGGKALVGLVGTSAVVVGGTVAYASVDKDFRRLVEDVVPGSNSLFGAVLGDLEPERPAPAPKKPAVSDVTPSKKRPAAVPVTAAPTLPTAPASPQPEKESPSSGSVPPPPLEKPAFMKEDSQKDSETKKKEDKPPATKETEKKKEKSIAPSSPPAVSSTKDEMQAPEELAPTTKDDTSSQPSSPSPKATSLKKDILDDEEYDVAPSSVKAGKDLHRKIGLVREELEAEMRTQLKRQAEAHSDHLNDALDVQKKEMTRIHIRELDELLEKASLAHRQELAAVMGHVRGLQSALENRSEMDHAALEAQELWLACSALQYAVESSEKEVRSIKQEIAAIRKVLEAHKEDPYVKAVLNGIPREVCERGVYSDSSIRERFLRVEKMAKRTAMIGDEGGSLFKYALSYLQSLFILDPSTHELPSKHVAVDIDALSTFDLVWLARGSLDRGDLEQAVRYVSLLKGEPANVSNDWLREARLVLETKQACRALLVHAAAVGVEAMPQRKKS